MEVIVQNCRKCPFHGFIEGFTRDCGYCKVNNKEITVNDKKKQFPDWCPLSKGEVIVKSHKTKP